MPAALCLLRIGLPPVQYLPSEPAPAPPDSGTGLSGTGFLAERFLVEQAGKLHFVLDRGVLLLTAKHGFLVLRQQILVGDAFGNRGVRSVICAAIETAFRRCRSIVLRGSRQCP